MGALKAIGTAIATHWSSIPQWGRSTIKWGSALVGLGGTAVATTGVGGSTLKSVFERPLQGSAELGAGAGVQQTKSSFFGMIGFFAEILKALGVGGGIPEAIMNFANRGHALGGGNPIHNEARWKQDDAKFGGQGLGADGMGGPDNGGGGGGFPWGTALGVGGAAGAGYLGYRYLKGSGPGPAQLDLFDNAPGVAKGGGAWSRFVSKGSELLGKLPGVGKLFRGASIAAAVGGTAVAGSMLLSSDAEAATLPTPGATASPATTVAAGVGTLQSVAAEAAGLGLSTLGARTAAQAIAPAAASLGARIGLRSIPGIASIIAAGETIYNTTSHALKGEWTQAGLSLASGAGQTVAGLGGIVTFGLGQAWAEGVRGVGIAAFGEDKAIKRSLVGQAIEFGGALRDSFSDAHDNRTPDSRTSGQAPGFQLVPAGM